MAKIQKPVCRFCKRYEEKLYLKGRRCESSKCPVDPRKLQSKGRSGGRTFKKKISEYGLQLREKGKVKIVYGVLERQFRNYFEMAKNSEGVTGEVLLQLLERRLDNVVYKLNWVYARRQARAVVSHGHILVNGKKVDRASFLVKVGDEISVKPTSPYAKACISIREERKGVAQAAWLESGEEMKAKVLRFPRRDEISLAVNEQLIINFYSK